MNRYLKWLNLHFIKTKIVQMHISMNDLVFFKDDLILIPILNSTFG